MNRVELLPAVKWVCPGCGKLNFEDVVVAEKTPEQVERMTQMVEQDAQEGRDLVDVGHLVLAPENVSCSSCGTKFKTDVNPVDESGGKA